MFDRGLLLTSQAIRHQLAAMPNELYLIRLIHNLTKRPIPGERLWTAEQLQHLATIRFLRARNREGCDIYVQPYAQDLNAGYILVDLDRAEPAVIAVMSAHGHEPCVVLQTSPGRLQAWVQVSSTPAGDRQRHRQTLGLLLRWGPRQYRLAALGPARRVY